MDENKQNIRLGIFVAGGLLLLLATLFYLGLSSLFVKKITVNTAFDESVQGLTIGSSVKYRGVPIGTVSDIVIDPEDRIIEVEMEIQLKNFSAKGKDAFTGDALIQYLKKEIHRGLRCRLEFSGITGMKYIDLNYAEKIDPNAVVAERMTPDSLLFLPSRPSSFTDLSATMITALDTISKIPFARIGEDLQHSLEKFTEIVSDPAIRSTLAHISETAERVESMVDNFARTFDEQELASIREELTASLKSFRKLSEKLEEQSQHLDVAGTQSDLQSLMFQLKETAESIQTLADYLENDPQSILYGKSKQDRE